MVNRVLYITHQPQAVDQARAWLPVERWELDYHAPTDDLLALLANTRYDAYLIDDPLGAEPAAPLIRLAREAGLPQVMVALTESAGRALVALKAGATDAVPYSALSADLLERLLRLAILQSNQHRLERQLVLAQRQEQHKTEMIRLVAHDLRSPLNTLNGYVDLLLEDLANITPPDPLNYLTEMQRGLERMNKLIGGILSLERIEKYRDGYTDLVDLNNVLEQVVQRYRGKIPQHFIYHPSQAMLWVLGAEDELSEAVENLLNNAVKYTPAHGEIELLCTADADSALIAVKDTGCGVPEKLQTNLFSPFFRANTPETRAIPGTGLGLHLVKQIIERHGGSIFFESVYGVGSTFGFLLPLTEDAGE